ncbi:MAG TPA: hypothetical protein ENL22_01535, partial [candidate division Zixibacteria bacterium]|nr:hypothetical protein [candidate division Zixibacteria bacterium]
MNSKIILIIIMVITFLSPVDAKQFSFRRQVIKKVELNGNKTFSDGKLKNQLLTKSNNWLNIFRKRRLSRTNLNIDEKQLKRFYGQNGFLFARVEAEVDYYAKDSSKVVVVFNIEEGSRVQVASHRISGGLPELNNDISRLARKIEAGKPANHDAILATAFRIRDYYTDNGYPFVSVRPKYEFSVDSSETMINFAIAESCYVYNGDINIIQEGETKTSEHIFRRELLIKTGEPYSRKMNIESQQRLYSTGLLKFVSLKRSGDLVHYSSDSAVTDLRLIITARKSNFINFRLGISEDEDFNSVFQPSISWGNRNLWGTGRKLTMSIRNSFQLAKKDEEEERAITISDLFSDLEFEPVKHAIEVNYTEPWFLGYRMPLFLAAVYEPNNKNPIINKFYDRLSGEASLAREIDRYTSLIFSTRIEFMDIHGANKEEEGGNSIRRRLSVNGQRDTRDNIFVPQKGSYSYASLDYVGHYLGGDFNYIKSEFYWSRYRFLFGENILASRFRIGALEELGDKGNSSSDDRFFLGGAKTIRGFAENNLGPKWTYDEAPTLDGFPKG